jgi:hypothetical protein
MEPAVVEDKTLYRWAGRLRPVQLFRIEIHFLGASRAGFPFHSSGFGQPLLQTDQASFPMPRCLYLNEDTVRANILIACACRNVKPSIARFGRSVQSHRS